jgi:hypothetical protein
MLRLIGRRQLCKFLGCEILHDYTFHVGTCWEETIGAGPQQQTGPFGTTTWIA